MKKKRILSGILIVFCFLSGCARENSDSTTKPQVSTTQEEVQQEIPYDEALPSDYAGVLTMWGWDDPYYTTITKAFQEQYPNVRFEYTPVGNGDLAQKYKTALITGSELPDIGWAIMAYRGEIFELDMWEALNREPYSFDLSQVYEYTHPLMVNSKGDVCGIEQSISVAGLAYRRDLAKEYLGTDDPKELEAMFPTWEEFIQKGKEVYEKSGGVVYMWPGLSDAQYFIREQNDVPWVEGNTVNLTDAFLHSIDITCKFRDSHTSDTLEAWTPEWYEALGKGTHIFTGCATWSIAFEIEPYDPEGKSLGRWGLMSAPEGNILWGGTAMGITKTCKDKRLAWEFIKFATLSTQGAKALNSIGLMSVAYQPYQEEPSLKSYKNQWFGEQDLGEYFLNEIVPKIKGRTMSKEDSEIHESLNMIAISLRTDSTITTEKAMEYLKEDLEEKLPLYEIE